MVTLCWFLSTWRKSIHLDAPTRKRFLHAILPINDDGDFLGCGQWSFIIIIILSLEKDAIAAAAIQQCSEINK
jgi:hypothetical protein